MFDYPIPIIIITCGVLGFIIYRFGLLDLKGSLVSFFIAVSLWAFRGLEWFFILFLLLVLGSLTTQFRLSKEKFVNPGSMRGLSNVFSNSGAALIFAALGSPLAFLSAVAAALSDTLASEIGIFSKKTKLITNMKKVRPGTNGGISLMGTMAALFGSLVISLTGFFFYSSYLIILAVFLLGFFGQIIDSFLGATLEDGIYVNKFHVNLFATFSAGLIGFLIEMVLL